MQRAIENDEGYLKPEELAVILRVKPTTILTWARMYKDFPALRLPGSIRVKRSAVDAWLKKFQSKEIE